MNACIQNITSDNIRLSELIMGFINLIRLYCKTVTLAVGKLLASKQTIIIIGQPIYSLSGGENIRIKILKSLKTTSTIYGIDEPFRGLNNTEIYKMALFFNKFIEKNKTVIVADHEDESFKYFTRRLMITNEKGILLGQTSSVKN